MRKLINLLMGLLFSFGLAGCMENVLPSQEILQSPRVASTKVSIEEALEAADNMLAELEGGTRSVGRHVESVEIVTTPSQTRSDSSDSLLYVVNYTDNAGFALLGTDSRMKEIYAISPKGHLNLNDTVKDEMFSSFINSAIKDAENSINSVSISFPSDSIVLVIPKYVSYKNKIVTSVDIPDYIAEIYAGDTYNELNKMVKASPTAVSLCKEIFILYSYERTNAPDLQLADFHDALIQKYDWTELQELVEYVDNANASSENIVECLKNFHIYIPEGKDITGCSCKSYWGLRANVHINQILNLLNGHPFIQQQGMMVTCKEDITNTRVPLFVLDRLMTRDKYVYRKFDSKLLEGPIPEIWMHCLWSEVGGANGYYLYDRKVDMLESPVAASDTSYTDLFILGGLMQDWSVGLH